MLPLLSDSLFSTLAADYRVRYGVDLFAVDSDGRIVLAAREWPEEDDAEAAQARQFVIAESWRWGECSASLCGRHLLVWGIAMTLNNKVTGGLIAVADESRGVQSTPDAGSAAIDVHAAGSWLRELAEEHNLTNAAALAARRALYEAEQHRAYVLHRDIGRHAAAIRSLYSREEPELFAAIRAGDRGEARKIVNRVLAAIYHHGGANLGLLKGFLLELIASMSRAAVETGADPEKLYGGSFVALSSLAEIDSPEAMAEWVRHTLEHLMDAVPAAGSTIGQDRILKALRHMERHSHRSVSLASAARAADLSPSRFCAVLKQETGTTFSRLLNRMRVDHSAVLLRTTDFNVGEIALRCGFSDQSYFTRIFRLHRGCTPRQFRQSLKP